jgi:hypothetical protein
MKFNRYLLKLPVNKLWYYLIICSFIFWGCNNGTDSSIESCIIIDLTLKQNSGTVDSHIIINKVIPLQTMVESAIGKIDKILIKGNRLIIIDMMKANSTFCFDLTGKYINKISNIGKAEGEYLINRDFISKYNGNGFYLFDKKLKKLLEYDDDLNFIKEYKVPISINSLIELQNESFMVERSSDNKYFISICNKEFNVIKEYIKRPDYLLHYDFNNPFPFKIKGNDILNYNPSFSNIIYEFYNNKFIKKYCIKDNVGFPNQLFFNSNKGVHPTRILQRFQNENFLSFMDFYENDYFLILKYYRGKSNNITLLNKRTSKIESHNTSDNKFKSILLNNVLGINTEGCFISYIWPYQLLEIDKSEELCEELIALLKKSNDQDNPMILFFDIKK